MLRTVTLVLFPVLVLFIAPVGRGADDLVISSGFGSGYYDTVARGLRAVLRSQYGTPLEIHTSEGSIANLTLLDDPASPVAIALTQADALKHYSEDHPGFASEIAELSDVGKECVFLITGKRSGIKSVADLETEGERALAVGQSGSGAAVTWEYLNRLQPPLRHTQPVNIDVIEAMLELKQTTQAPAVAAVMLVQRPRTLSGPVEIVLDHRDDYEIVPIRKGDIGASSFEGGRPVYTFEKASAGFGRDYRVSFDTICTRGLLIASKAKLSEEQLKTLGEAVATSRGYIAPGAD